MRNIEHLIYGAGEIEGAFKYNPVQYFVTNIDIDLSRVQHFINGGLA